MTNITFYILSANSLGPKKLRCIYLWDVLDQWSIVKKEWH